MEKKQVEKISKDVIQQLTKKGGFKFFDSKNQTPNKAADSANEDSAVIRGLKKNDNE